MKPVRRILRPMLMCVIAGIGAFLPSSRPVSAQRVIVAPRRAVFVRRWRWGYYSPADALASRVAARAVLLRARGDFLVDRAAARQIRAAAVAQEIVNWEQRFKAYWSIRERGEREYLKRLPHFLADHKRRQAKLADVYLNHPELNRYSVANAKSLNFFLYELSGSVLAYKFGKSQADRRLESLESLDEFRLTTAMKHALRLRTKTKNGNRIVVRADSTKADIPKWPYVLLAESRMTFARSQFEKARATVQTEASVANIKNLDQALMELRNRFEIVFTDDRKFQRNFKSWAEVNAANRFLKNLAGEVGRFKESGSTQLFGGNVEFKGHNLIDLLKHMARYGLEFHEADKPDEWAYFAVHKMMRDIYAGTKAIEREQSGG